MSAFGRLEPRLQEKIVHKLGWTSLRPVQELATEAILDNANCIILAPTAGGKTEASMFPVISGCLSNQELGLRALYICPTRALINNQEQRLSEYAEMIGLNAFKWHGDVSSTDKKNYLKNPSEILLTTPESLEVMLVSGSVPTAKLFKHLRYVVIDEVHALAACDRGNHLISILERIRAYAQGDFQRIGLSATVGNPLQILEWMQGSSQNSKRLVDPPKVKSKKSIEIHWTPSSYDINQQAIKSAQGIKSLLFCESRRLAEEVSGGLKKTGEPVYVHHSSLSRDEREEAEKQFHEGTEACIVCTSTMELGIDVGDLDKVLQVNSPKTVSSFLQRMGRTGRRSNTTANTTFFIEKAPFLLQSIAIVELAKSKWVEDVPTNTAAWHILLHQIMAMCLERGAVNNETLWNQLHHAYCYKDISKEKFIQFTKFLLAKDILHDDGGIYSMGIEAEKAFGRKNFMEIYAVFSTPVEFEVISQSAEVIGTIEWSFLEKLLEEAGSFYLGGKAWQVVRIEWKRKKAIVKHATSGKIPKWGGLSPSFLSYTLCRKIRDTLISEEVPTYLTPSAQRQLEDLRDDKADLLNQGFAPYEQDDKGIKWWTYAGGNINSTLRFVFTIELGLECQATNEYIILKGEELARKDFEDVLVKISNEEYWTDQVLRNLTAMMPDYRLSKFQPFLPEQLQLKLVADELLDNEGTRMFLEGYFEG